MRLLERAKNVGLIVTLGIVAGTQVFIVHEVIQSRSADDEIKQLVNDSKFDVIDRIANDTVDKLIALKDQEIACEVLETTISSNNHSYNYDKCLKK